jgi:hypothetical protein
MCHDWWMRRERRREEQFDEELMWLLDEEGERPGPVPIVKHEREGEPADPERPSVEAATR